MGEKFLNWLEGIARTLGSNVLSALVVLVIGLLVIRAVMKLVKRTLRASRLEKAAHTLILSLCRAALYLLLGLIAASSLGIDVTGIVALASVLTLALSLALQNMVTNILGGFTLLSTHPFHSGDYVEIAGQSGTVEEINMTYTRLATPDNKQISIPNSAVVAAQIVNYTASGTRRVEFRVRGSYDVAPQKIMDALVLAGTVDNVLLDPAPQAMLSSYGESCINYSLRLWVKSSDYWDVYFLVNQRIYQIFQEQGIHNPYPQVQLRVENRE